MASQSFQNIPGKEIEKFCFRATVPPEVELICATVLIVTEGMRYPDTTTDTAYIW